jgi:hypothetical protein
VLAKVKFAVRAMGVPTGAPTPQRSSPRWMAIVESPMRLVLADFLINFFASFFINAGWRKRARHRKRQFGDDDSPVIPWES